MADLVLASGSPRRRELLAELGVRFVVDAADIDEVMMGDPVADAERLAREKAMAIAVRHPGAVVLGSDTIVHDGTRAYGKPQDEADAVEMLTTLCGREHQVHTGIAVAAGGSVRCGVSSSTVWLQALSAAEIRRYAHGAGHLDKAGAYAIQDAANPIVDRYIGCYCSIMGLPLCETQRLLGAAGLAASEPGRDLTACRTCPERAR